MPELDLKFESILPGERIQIQGETHTSTYRRIDHDRWRNETGRRDVSHGAMRILIADHVWRIPPLSHLL